MQVMMALGSPGMRISVAVTSPPLTPPTKMAISSTTASTLGMVKVNGSTSTISVPVLMPGSTPMAMPSNTPKHRIRNEAGSARCRKASSSVTAAKAAARGRTAG